MCLQPRIIINPSYVQKSAFGRFVGVHMPFRDFFYQRNAFDEFDYKTFSVKRNGVTSKNMDDFYAYTLDGLTMPLYLEVPCGHCSVCVYKKQNDIKNKLLLEQASYDCQPLFLTLTYNDFNLPADGVSIPDVQKFLKRFRAYVEYNHPINQHFRYCCFSEYGGTGTRRPHYHILIFGFQCSPRDILKLQDDFNTCWGLGFVYLEHCDHQGFEYCSKYVCKGSNVPPGKNPNFRLSSRRGGGLGVPLFRDESIYLRLIQSAHPTISVKILGKSMRVFVPKSIRQYLCKSPRQFVPQRILNHFKSFCYKSVLLKALMDHSSEFSSHAQKFIQLAGVTPPSQSSIIPRHIYDKFASLQVAPIDVKIPWYILSTSSELLKIHGKPNEFNHTSLIQEYVKLYKILDDFYLDFDKLFHYSYLRSTVYESWRLSLMEFAANNPDADAFALAKFRGILIETHKHNHPT